MKQVSNYCKDLAKRQCMTKCVSDMTWMHQTLYFMYRIYKTARVEAIKPHVPY